MGHGGSAEVGEPRWGGSRGRAFPGSSSNPGPTPVAGRTTSSPWPVRTMSGEAGLAMIRPWRPGGPVAARQERRDLARVERRTAPRRSAEALRLPGVCSSAAAGRGQDTAALRPRRSAPRGLHDSRGAGPQGIGPWRVCGSSLGARSALRRVEERRVDEPRTGERRAGGESERGGSTARAAAVPSPGPGGPPPSGRGG